MHMYSKYKQPNRILVKCHKVKLSLYLEAHYTDTHGRCLLRCHQQTCLKRLAQHEIKLK